MNGGCFRLHLAGVGRIGLGGGLLRIRIELSKEGAAMWCVLVKVGQHWVVAAKLQDGAEAARLGEVLQGMGKSVRVTLY